MPEVTTAFSFEDMSHPARPLKSTRYSKALENYFHFTRRIGVRDGRLPRQVHSTRIVEAPASSPKLPLIPTMMEEEADAIWTDRSGNWVGVLTADCLPVLLESKDKVMAVHAGWRGLSAGILRDAVRFLGGGDGVVQATMGPAARACCYTVHEDVIETFRRNDVDPVVRGTRIDLPDTARRHLESLGVTNIRHSEPFGCTICDRRFNSHRRDGTASGRNLAAIAVL